MRQTVRAILLNRNNSLLLVQHKERDPNNQGKWATVGGGVEKTEKHNDALTRELVEEFGPTIDGKIAIGPNLYTSNRPDRIDYFYVVWFDDEDLTPIAPDEIMTHRWFELEEVKNLQLFFGFEKDLYLQALQLPR